MNLTNEIAVDCSQAAELLDNGETGDARVVLFCAPNADDNEWLFYLVTNGDPVLLTETDTAYTSGPAAWLETLGLDVDTVARAIAGSPADEISTEWALATIGVEPNTYLAATDDDTVIVETMPDQFRGSHRASGNWGVWPLNGATRIEMSRADAEELVAGDEDGYDHIVD